jgi:hypothetical protein
MLSGLSLTDSSSDISPQASLSDLSGFQKLPTELKLLICKHTVTQSKPIDLSKRRNQIPPETTYVSKLFHDEGSKLYYRENTFLLPLPSRLGCEENLHLDQWLCDASTTEVCKQMSKIIVQVSLPPDRSSLANLLLLATSKLNSLRPIENLPTPGNILRSITRPSNELSGSIATIPSTFENYKRRSKGSVGIVLSRTFEGRQFDCEDIK